MPGVPRRASALAGGMTAVPGRTVVLSTSGDGTLPAAPAEHQPGRPDQKYVPVGRRCTFAVTGAASAMDQIGKVQRGPASLLRGRSGNPGPFRGDGKSHLSKISRCKTKEASRKKIPGEVYPMAATQRFGCSLDPDLLLLDFRDRGSGNHCLRPGYGHEGGRTGGNKIQELPLSAAVRAFIQGFAVSAGVHKYMELDTFENMSALKPMH